MSLRLRPLFLQGLSALVRLCGCAGQSDPSQFVAINIKFYFHMLSHLVMIKMPCFKIDINH